MKNEIGIWLLWVFINVGSRFLAYNGEAKAVGYGGSGLRALDFRGDQDLVK